jgi:hypothetical protein
MGRSSYRLSIVLLTPEEHHARHGAIPRRSEFQREHEEARAFAALVSVRELRRGTPLLGSTQLMPRLRPLPLGGRDQACSAHGAGLNRQRGSFGRGRWPARTTRSGRRPPTDHSERKPLLCMESSRCRAREMRPAGNMGWQEPSLTVVALRESGSLIQALLHDIPCKAGASFVRECGGPGRPCELGQDGEPGSSDGKQVRLLPALLPLLV